MHGISFTKASEQKTGKKFQSGSVKQRGIMTPALQMGTEARGFPDLPREHTTSLWLH